MGKKVTKYYRANDYDENIKISLPIKKNFPFLSLAQKTKPSYNKKRLKKEIISLNKNKINLMGKLKRLVPFFRPYKGLFILDLICTVLMVAVELAFPLLVRMLMNYGLSPEIGLDIQFVLKIGAAILFLRLVDAAAGYYVSGWGHIMGARIENDIREKLFDHLQKLSFSYYDNVKIGTLMSRMTSDLFDITEFAHHAPEEVLTATLKIVGSFVILAGIDLPLTLILFAALPFMLLFASKFNRKMHILFRERRIQAGMINADLEDSLAGVRVVRSFSGEEIEKEKFAKGNQKLLDARVKAYKYMGVFHASLRFFEGFMYLVAVMAGALFVMAGRIQLSDVVAYLLYVTTLLTSIRRFAEFTEQLQNGLTGFERYLEIMDTEPDIVDHPKAIEAKNIRGDIEFHEVSFHYPGNEEEILSKINLHIRPGEHIALVGPSGGGKTTLCSLLPRFYEPTVGEITLDGKDLRDYTMHSLRNSVGVIQQEVYLFGGTVAENIEYGRPGASREEIMKAAKLASAYDFVMELPEGFDTDCGERGVKLSGGQKQRIAIARAFLKNPPVLILDEATSALDNESELAVQQSLARLAEGRTTLTIAHRLSTIRGADRILVLTDEGIVEEGKHEELLEKQGLYARLYYASQNSESIILQN